MVKYKEFRVGDLFEIHKTKSCNTNKLTPVTDVMYPYVTRTSLNNGVNDYTGLIEGVVINEANTFSLGLLGMDFFHQKTEWYAGQFVRKITPKFEMSDRLAQYFKTYLDAQKEVLLKVLVRNVDDMFENEMVFQLPSTPQGTPDFDFMENYIKEIEQKHIKKLESDLNSRNENLLTVIGREDLIGDPDGLAAVVAAGFDDSGVDYAEFRVGELFDVKSTKKTIHKNMIDPNDWDGQHPYITRTTQNNGLSGYIDYDEDFLNDANTISLGLDTYTLSYQPDPYFTGNKVKVLHLKDYVLNSQVAMYLISVYNRMFEGYDWGTGINQQVIVDMKLTLPVTPIGQPDFNFMAQYIAHIELKHTHSLMQWMKAKESI